MTTNQTIDGVPREWLENYAGLLAEHFALKKAKAVRALLDAPIPFPGYPPVPEDRKLPVAQSQGEPVAVLYVSRESFDDEACVGMHGTKYPTPVQDMPLYAEQPAPVAVVMPERKAVSVGVLSESNTHNQGWNACLDELKRLNPSL